MKYLYLGDGPDGVSAFEDREIAFADGDFAPPAPPMGMSATLPATGLLYLTLPPGWRDTRHPSPRRQVAFCLAGRMRVTAGNGTVRMIEPGGVWQMEDTEGAGHGSEVVGDDPVRLAIVQLA
ncbi:hypothetical protein HKCCE2091_18830 [Rhodobacterales bacterium HKCCE2091]|nr:hypothetical protein [Rhodobacterales bacterium HKCCE2091]